MRFNVAVTLHVTSRSLNGAREAFGSLRGA